MSYNEIDAFISSFINILENSMVEKTLHEIIANNLIQLMNKEQSHAPSMRYLSTCIGTSAGYIQKINSGKAFPSCEKLLALANHYEVEPWTLLFDKKQDEELYEVILELSSCPRDMMPVIKSYIEYLKNQENTSKS